MSRSNECKEMPPVEYLKECFDYDPEAGVLRWSRTRPRHHFNTESKWKMFHTKWAGTPAGCKHLKKNGDKAYMQVHVSNVEGRKLENSMLMVHRICATLAGLALTADLLVDHINGDVWDNRASNLRLATRSQNAINCKPHADKGSKLPRGVYQQKGKPGFYARISLGCFATPELAHEAVCKAARLYHGEFARFD